MSQISGVPGSPDSDQSLKAEQGPRSPKTPLPAFLGLTPASTTPTVLNKAFCKSLARCSS